MKLSSKSILFIIGIIILLFAFIYWGGSVFLPDFSNEVVVKDINSGTSSTDSVGAKAPYFDLVDINQNRIKLSSFSDSPLIILFWSTWNGEAADQLKIFDDYLNNSDKGLVKIVTINSQEERSVSASFIKRGNYNVSVAVDSDGSVTEKYNIKSLPTTIFVDREGVIREIYSGVLSEKMIVDKMEQLLR